MTVERSKPKSVWRKIERWMVGVVMAMIAFVLEKMVLRSVRKAGKAASEPGGAPHDPHVQGR